MHRNKPLQGYCTYGMAREFCLIVLSTFYYGLASICISETVYAQVTFSKGARYYSLLAMGEYEYYQRNNIQNAVTRFHTAFSLRTPFYQDYYSYIKIWQAEKNYDSMSFYLRKAIPLGLPREIAFLDDQAFLKSRKGQEINKEFDQLRNLFTSGLNIRFIKFLERLIGQDQILRILSHELEEEQCDFGALIQRADAHNRNSFLSYIIDNGFPDLQRLDYATQNNLSILLNHYISLDTSQVFVDSFFLIFREQFDLGNMLPHIIATAVDYAYKYHGLQVYGTFSFSEIPIENPHYDSLRAILGRLPRRMEIEVNIAKQKRLNANSSYK